MSSRLPSLTPRKLIAALKGAGYYETGQTGSHLMLEHASRNMVVVPVHAKDVKRPLLKAIIKQAGFSEAAFLKLL
jgi:predicted RNA binding protein YcfA (HicA-like mRNA interferase family)